MVLLIHIVAALVSVGFTTYTAYKPSQKLFVMSVVLFLAACTSGFVLFFSPGVNIPSACISGGLYSSYVLFLLRRSAVRIFRVSQLQ